MLGDKVFRQSDYHGLVNQNKRITTLVEYFSYLEIQQIWKLLET
jgi:hypothetical protein